MNKSSKIRTAFSLLVIGAACALLLVGFCLPWFSSPDFALLAIGNGPFKQSVPEQVSGLNMLFGGMVYALAYAPSIVPQVFALLWLIPVCALLITGLALAELVGWLWRRPWSRGSGYVRLALYTLLFVLMGMLLGPIIVGPTGPLFYRENRMFGLWVTLAGFVLLLLSMAFLHVGAAQQSFSTAREVKSDQQATSLARRRALSSLLGLVAATTLGTGGYLLERLWAGRHTLASFPLVTSSRQPSKQVWESAYPLPRMGRVAWSSDGKRVFTFADIAYYPGSRDAFSGAHVLTYLFPTQDIALSPDGKYLALLDPTRGTPAIVTAQDGVLVAASWTQQVLATAEAACVAWSPDGKRMAIGGVFQKPNTPTVESAGILCYDAFSKLNQRMYKTTSPGGTLYAVSWSPNGRYLAGAGANVSDTDNGRHLLGDVFIWEAASGQLLFKIPANYWASMAWSPDSQRLAVGQDNIVAVWALSTTARKVLEYHGHQMEIWSIAWSPDGKYIASASDADGLVHVWEAATGQLRYLYQGHISTVTDISWSPNSVYVVTCDGSVNAVHVWQPQI